MVALVVAMPSMMLPGLPSDATEIVALLAILLGILTFAEYNTAFPSFIEFRDAPPLNRMRFLALLCMFTILTLVAKHRLEPSEMTGLVAGFAAWIGLVTDFPFSPVHLCLLMLPADALPQTVDAVRTAAGVCYVIAMITILWFLFVVRMLGWPTSTGAFNVWVNLPLFDPTTGGDVVYRLNSDARKNVVVGILLPFLIPAAVALAGELFEPVALTSPQTVIWAMTAWALLPATMVMRGIAMARIAELIEQKRRRVYATAEAMQAA